MFRDPELNRRILEREREAAKAGDKSWVHTLMLAWQRDYIGSRRLSGRLMDRRFLGRYRDLIEE